MTLSLYKNMLIAVLATSCLSPVSMAYTKSQVKFLPMNVNQEKQSGPYYKAVLPTSIYLNSIKPDLSDIRVKNAEGDYLAYAFIDEEATSFQMSSAKAPIFPLYADVQHASQEQSNASVTIIIQQDGSLALTKSSQLPSSSPSLSLSPSAAGSAKKQIRPIKGWIFDASQLISDIKFHQYLLQAQVEIAQENKGIVDFSLESSDDLQNWTSAYASQQTNAHQQLVQLQHQGALIQKLTIDLHSSRAKYWRLMWINPDNAFDIRSVSLISQEKIFPLTVLTWGATIQASQCDQHACEYTLPRNTPIDSLRIQLGEVNTLAKMTIVGKRPQQVITHHRRHLNPFYVLHRRNQTSHYKTQVQEEYLNEATVYRLQLRSDATAVTQSEDIALNGQTYTHLRLITQSDMRSLGKQLPSIQIGTFSRNIVFLARGKEPYSLHWGEENAVGAALPLTTLIPNAINLLNNKMGEAQLAPISYAGQNTAPKLETIKPEKNQHKYWFWAVLGIGLLLLCAMVWSFLNGMNEAKEEAKEETSI
jgi:hypothetical protein